MSTLAQAELTNQAPKLQDVSHILLKCSSPLFFTAEFSKKYLGRICSKPESTFLSFLGRVLRIGATNLYFYDMETRRIDETQAFLPNRLHPLYLHANGTLRQSGRMYKHNLAEGINTIAKGERIYMERGSSW